MAKGVDLTGKRVGKLTVLYLVPREQRKTQQEYKARIWMCHCDCGKEVEVRATYLIGNHNYTQLSCGCRREIQHFLATVKVAKGLEEFLESFDDFEKVRFIHQAMTRTSGNTAYSITPEFFQKFITYFYYNEQFSILYDYWKQQNSKINTFYDWLKPSIDHKIPKSKGGSNELENLHFLTVFENLAKRDMSWDDWLIFKKETNTKSDLFYDSIKSMYKKGGKDLG